MELEVKNVDGMLGLYSNRLFRSGETIIYLRGEAKSEPTRHSIKVADGVHIEDHYGYYVNHSCHPSANVNGRLVVATKDIDVGDEITFDYKENEDALVCPFVCNCCGKLIE
jgi:hypothetical protein